MKLDMGAILSQMDTGAPQLCVLDDAQCARIAARLRAKCRPHRVRRIALIAAVLVLAAAVVGCAVVRPDIPVQWYHTLMNGLFDRNINLVSSNVVSVDLTRLETEDFTITLESTLFTADAAYATFVVDGTLPEDFAISTEMLDAPSPGAQKDFWGNRSRVDACRFHRRKNAVCMGFRCAVGRPLRRLGRASRENAAVRVPKPQTAFEFWIHPDPDSKRLAARERSDPDPAFDGGQRVDGDRDFGTQHRN